MTQVFLYEFVTGGGWWSVDPHSAPQGSLLNEALAMIRALAEDFSRLPGIAVSALWDSRLPGELAPCGELNRVASTSEEKSKFSQFAQRADYTLLIAPEFDGHLWSRVGWAANLNCRLLSPNRGFVRLASNKHETAETLIEGGVPAPLGVLYSAGMSTQSWLQWPAVLKPCDGAGSLDVRLVRSRTELEQLEQLENFPRAMRFEEYCPGTAASISLLCGPNEIRVLPAGRQILSDRGDFQYLGGELPLSAAAQTRAADLARRVLKVLPKTNGYVGIDLVLGDASDGSRDFVIEVNPRLTTSYVGLRTICQQNLAGAMLAIARGETVELTFAEQPVRFGV